MMANTEEQSSDLQLKVVALRQQAKSRGIGVLSESKKKQGATDVVLGQLPLWQENVRGLPNALARSALFTIGNSSDLRQQHKGAVIFALQGIEMSYTGEELRQDDEDVFLQLIHLARLQPISCAVEVSAYQLLKELGWGSGKADYTRLRGSIERMKANSLSLKQEKDRANPEKGYSASLIRKFEWEGMVRWRITFEPEIIKLFGENEFTKLDWLQRKQLSTMAKKLHSFYFTHREPFGLYTKTLHQICASRIKVMSKYRYKLKQALDELKLIEFLDSWEIDDNDVVRVIRTRSAMLQAQPR